MHGVKGWTFMNRTRRLTCVVAGWMLLGAAMGWRGAPAGDEWLPISPEDLALKDNPASPGAHAMILYREDRINANAGTEDEYARVKVFTSMVNKDNVDETGTIRIAFNPFVRIENIHGRTIHADGSIANFDGKTTDSTLVRPDGTKYFVKAFTLPEVKPGCIFEYRFRKQYDNTRYWSEDWTIQSDSYMRLGRFSILPSTNSRAPKRLYYREYGLPSNAKPVQMSNGGYELEVHDLPGIEKEDLMPPEGALRARVSFFYRDISAGMDESADAFWKRTGKKWNDDVEAFLNKRSVLSAEVAKVTSASDTPDEKLRKLQARVREIRDLDYERKKNKEEKQQEDIKTNANVEDVLKHGYATGRHVNLLFVGLARAAGFSAGLVYLAPRSETEFMPENQDTGQLTADAVWVFVGDKEIYLDPTSRFQPYGTLPWSETASKGIKVSKDGAQFVTMPTPTSADATIVRKAVVELSEDGAATGKIHVEFTGYRAAAWRQDLRDDDEAGRRKRFENVIQGWLPNGATAEVSSISDWEKVGEPVRVEATFKIPELGSAIGHRMLVPATIFRTPYAKTFAPAKRVNLIYFHFPFEDRDELEFKAPQGFTVETTPVAKKFDTGAVYYEIESTQQGATASVKRRLAVNTIVVPVENYPTLRAVFSGVKANDEAQIVLQNPESASKN
jgi:hypothetical protein